MLGELAELGLMVAKELAVRLRECEDVEQAVALADAFQKASRVVRLTLALDFKLDRDAVREAREQAREAQRIEAEEAQIQAEAAPVTPPPRAPDPVKARKDRLHGLLHRLLWNESEGDTEEFEILRDDLSARLDEAARSADFETLPIETLARRVIADIGLSGELTLSVCEQCAPSPLVGEGVRRRPDG
jgi:D-serine deaminase-like pyridoxal phosphate-dependent protein